MITRDQWLGLFLGAAIGDVLGVPVETMTYMEILAATDGQGVTGYLPGIQTKIRDTGNSEPGQTSDDTQLAMLTAGSLLANGCFDIEDQARVLVEAYRRNRFGWGGTTKRAAAELEEWFKSNGREGRSPHTPTPQPLNSLVQSAGSGPAMKVYPLAAFCLLGRKRRDFVTPAIQLGRLTHGNPSAVIASVAVGEAVDLFATADPRSSGSLRPSLRAAEEKYPDGGVFCERLERALFIREDSVALRDQINLSFLAVHSVPFAIATAFRHQGDFQSGVLEAVNAGRDADTTASIVGALLGVQVGLAGIPSEWVEGLLGVDRIKAMAEAMYLMCCHGYSLGDLSRIVDANLLHPY